MTTTLDQLAPRVSNDTRGDIGLVITVVSPRGGVGKTTIATTLAVRYGRYHHQEYRATLVDADLAYGTASWMLGLDPPRTLADASTTSPEANIIPADCGIDIVASPSDPVAAEHIQTSTVTHVVRHLASRPRVIVIDTAAGLDEAALAVIDLADIILVPVTGDPFTLRSTVNYLRLLQRLGIDPARIVPVGNRVGAPHFSSVREMSHLLNTDIPVAFPDSSDVSLASKKGRTLAWDWPDHPFAQAGDHLINTLSGATFGSTYERWAG